MEADCGHEGTDCGKREAGWGHEGTYWGRRKMGQNAQNLSTNH